MSDFTKRHPKREKVSINHETGTIHVPGVGDLPLKGDFTSGFGYEELKRKEQEWRTQTEPYLLAKLRKTWQCTQCKRIIAGQNLKAKHRFAGSAGDLVTPVGASIETHMDFVRNLDFVCPGYLDEHGQQIVCDAPVVEYTGPSA